MTEALVTTYTTNKGAITNLTVNSYSFNLYDAVTYGGQTKYVAVYSGGTATGIYGGAFSSSPIGQNVTISTPTAGTVVFISGNQIYLAGVYEEVGKTLTITYNGETLSGGTWISGTSSWFFPISFMTPPSAGTVISYQYVSPAPPPSPGQTYIPTEGRVPVANLLPEVRTVAKEDLVPASNDKNNLIPS